MKYEHISKSELMPRMGATLRWVEALDATLTDVEIVLRDTDHTYDSLRFEFYDKNMEKHKVGELINTIYNYINTHCCLCGSDDDVKLKEDCSMWDDSICNILCKNCMAADIKKNKGEYAYIMFCLEKSISMSMNPKIRVKYKDGGFAYCRLNDVIFSNNKLYLEDKKNWLVSKNKKEIHIVGLDTGIRDINDERVYHGDVIVGEDKDGYKFGGVILDRSDLTHYHCKLSNVSPQWSRFTLWCQNAGVLFSLDLAKNFKVIGSVGEINDYSSQGADFSDCAKWFSDNVDKFNSFFI